MRETQKPIARWGLSVATAVAVAFLAAGSLRVGAQAPANGTRAPKEGITVHGHWTIDVRQPDGTLVTHREFENALTAQGAALIADLLAGRVVPSNWRIGLVTENLDDSPCMENNGAPTSCTMWEPAWSALGIDPTSQREFYNLQRAPSGFGLSGTATVRRAGRIDFVAVAFNSCNLPRLEEMGLAPSRCAIPAADGRITGSGVFSAATVSIPNLVVNQLIQASVTYTFEAGQTHVN